MTEATINLLDSNHFAAGEDASREAASTIQWHHSTIPIPIAYIHLKCLKTKHKYFVMNWSSKVIKKNYFCYFQYVFLFITNVTWNNNVVKIFFDLMLVKSLTPVSVWRWRGWARHASRAVRTLPALRWDAQTPDTSSCTARVYYYRSRLELQTIHRFSQSPRRPLLGGCDWLALILKASCPLEWLRRCSNFTSTSV